MYVRLDPLAAPETEADRPPTPATRTVEIQTDYRDSETQTDPYTPEYVVRPGSQPELLTLATLSYGKVSSLAIKHFDKSEKLKTGLQITVGHQTLADHNLPMSDEIPTVVRQNVQTTFFFALLSGAINNQSINKIYLTSELMGAD